MTPFRELFRLSVAHSYYAGACRDFEYIIPQETARMLKQGRLLAKVADGVLRVLFETDGSTAPLVSIAGTTLRFGLRLANPYFSNFTTVAADFHSAIQR
jgi:hypothetical protein